MYFIALLVALTIDSGHGFSDLEIGSLKCAVSAGDRIACGPSGVTKEKCNARRCCFDSRAWHTIWCFKKRDNRPGCYVDPGQRTACAGAGVTPAQCLKNGCCYNSARSDSIWCFKENASPDAWKCAVPENKRIACAGSGVTPAECKKKGCCFNSSRYNTVWCFRPKGPL